MALTMNRRDLLGMGAAAALCAPTVRAFAQTPFRLGLTPVFLDNDALIIEKIIATLRTAMGQPIDLLQRRTYQEITGLLLEGSIDAAWLCGFPYLRHAAALSLVAAPFWQGRPFYQSYLIAATGDPANDLTDLEGGVHAFSDPDSNSGWLVTASDLARLNETPDGFFGRSFFTYGHRNVVRAVASGLARSGSVDGYVWEVLSQVEPNLTARTRVIARSEWLGFPPFVTRAGRLEDPRIRRFADALLGMSTTRQGQDALQMLRLDGFRSVDPIIYDGIAARMRQLEEAS